MSSKININQWFAFYGNEIEAELKAVGAGQELTHPYIKLCWNYWSINHCAGLVDDEAVLRRICEASNPVTWSKVKPVLLGHIFKLDDDGLWHYARLKTLREETEAKIKLKSDAGKKGMASRYGKATA